MSDVTAFLFDLPQNSTWDVAAASEAFLSSQSFGNIEGVQLTKVLLLPIRKVL